MTQTRQMKHLKTAAAQNNSRMQIMRPVTSPTLRDGRCVVLLHRGTRRRTIGRVRALVRGPLEEVVLQRVVGRDASLRVAVEHAKDQVLELEIVGERVALFAGASPRRTASLYAQHVVELTRPWSLVLWE